jgi:putative ABC transport system permease protein
VLDLDRWQEIASTLARNKLRTALTALGVFWGIFLLLLMVGFGKGLEQGALASVGGNSSNAIFVWSQRTQLPYHGLRPGRFITFDDADVEALRRSVAGIAALAPRDNLGSVAVVCRERRGSFEVVGSTAETQEVRPMLLVRGRLLDALDDRESRKVAVIPGRAVDELFAPGEDPIGASVEIRGIRFQIVGVARSPASGENAERANSQILVPLLTFQRAFQRGRAIGWFGLTAAPEASAAAVEQEVRALLMRRHFIAPDDERALGSFNAGKEYRKVQGLFTGIRVFIWFVGLCTLLAGVIGVSNIMLITVKERTREIGLRKALGATSWSVIALVMQEAVVLTSLAGYAGIVAAVALIEGAGWLVSRGAAGGGQGFFRAPSVDLTVALAAAAILVAAGCLVGIMPARHAAAISPCEALRAE